MKAGPEEASSGNQALIIQEAQVDNQNPFEQQAQALEGGDPLVQALALQDALGLSGSLERS